MESHPILFAIFERFDAMTSREGLFVMWPPNEVEEEEFEEREFTDPETLAEAENQVAEARFIGCPFVVRRPGVPEAKAELHAYFEERRVPVVRIDYIGNTDGADLTCSPECESLATVDLYPIEPTFLIVDLSGTAADDLVDFARSLLAE